jgi:hypothetical protein
LTANNVAGSCVASSSASSTFTVNPDTEKPIFTTTPGSLDQTITCADAAALAAAQAMLPVGTDNCTTTMTAAKTAGAFTPSMTIPHAGTYTNTFTLTDACGNTSLPFTQVITISPAGTADAGPDQMVCAASPTATLAGVVGGGATTGSWTGGLGTFNPDANTLNATYTPHASEIAAGTVTLTFNTGMVGPCPVVTDAMTITINRVNGGVIAASQTICSDANPAASPASNFRPAMRGGGGSKDTTSSLEAVAPSSSGFLTSTGFFFADMIPLRLGYLGSLSPFCAVTARGAVVSTTSVPPSISRVAVTFVPSNSSLSAMAM